MKNAKNAVALDLPDNPKDRLPHLYGFPWYKWAKEFFDSTNKLNFLCAANQISKSSTMIRKAIYWATETSLWPELWDTKPTQFWYFYPDKSTATREFKEKILKEFLPKDPDDPKYGWKAFFEYQKIHRIEFKSGVTIYFMSYQQQLSDIQSSSVYAMFCDEEAPVSVYDEVAPRIWATNGYFHMVFTATMGQEFWRRVMEETGAKEEFPNAFKRQVTMYDCVEYLDGSASPWTLERIEERSSSCRTESERLRRIYGRFILAANRLYSKFEETGHVIKKTKADADWSVFAGSFKNAIVLVKVNPAFNRAEVVDGWMVEEDEESSALSTYLQYRLLSKKTPVTYAYADRKHSVDFVKVAVSGGSAFEVVRKPKDNGEKLVNSLLEAKILKISGKKSLENLVLQMRTVRRDHEELDGFDLVGALITVVSNVPWNFSEIFNRKVIHKDPNDLLSKRERFYKGLDRPSVSNDTYDNEIEEINEAFYEEGS